MKCEVWSVMYEVLSVEWKVESGKCGVKCGV